MRKSLFLFSLLFSLVAFSQNQYGLEYQRGFGRSYNSNSIGGTFEKFNSNNGSW